MDPGPSGLSASLAFIFLFSYLFLDGLIMAATQLQGALQCSEQEAGLEIKYSQQVSLFGEWGESSPY